MAFLHQSQADQRKAALQRRADAIVLQQSGRWRGAMYMLGYHVECHIKARLMEMYDASTLTQLELILARRFEQDVNLKSHRIEYLFGFLEARGRLVDSRGDQQNLRAFQTCNRWDVQWRYSPASGTESDCLHFFDAVDRFVRFITHSV